MSVARPRRRQDKVALAYAAERGGNLEEAERLYQKAIRENDRNAFNNLAQLLIDRGELDEAERLFRRGVKAGDPLAAKNLVLFLLEEGREVAARRVLSLAKSLGRPPTEKELAEARRYHAGQDTTRRSQV